MSQEEHLQQQQLQSLQTVENSSIRSSLEQSKQVSKQQPNYMEPKDMGPNTIASRRLKRYQDEGIDEFASPPERKSVQGIVKPKQKKVKTEKM